MHDCITFRKRSHYVEFGGPLCFPGGTNTDRFFMSVCVIMQFCIHFGV